MKVCPKCSKKFEPDWSICLDCNELLQTESSAVAENSTLSPPIKKPLLKQFPILQKLLWVVFVLIVPMLACVILNITHSRLEKEVRDAAVRQAIEAKEEKPVLPKGFLRASCENSQWASENFCVDSTRILLARDVSVLVAVIGTVLFLFITAIGFIGRINRDFLVFFFSLGLYVSLIAGGIMLVANGVVLMYTAYIAEVIFANSYHPALIFSIGIIMLGGALGLLKPAFGIIRKAKSFVIGKRLSKEEYPGVWQLVEAAASKLKSLMPDNILVGLGVNFYVTETNVTCLKDKLKGRTLFLSLPLMRKLGKDELVAIVGHELGHFRGADTFYSQKFYPIYKGAHEGLETLTPNEGDSNFVMLPVYALFTHFMDEFSKIESGMSRSRELLADKAAVELTSSEIMASALTKIYAFSNFWSTVENKMIQMVKQKQKLLNCSQAYAEFIDKITEEDLLKVLHQEPKIPHPTDTHPSFQLRLKELGFDISHCNQWLRKMMGEASTNMLQSDLEKIETELNDIEHTRLFQIFGSASN